MAGSPRAAPAAVHPCDESSDAGGEVGEGLLGNARVVEAEGVVPISARSSRRIRWVGGVAVVLGLAFAAWCSSAGAVQSLAPGDQIQKSAVLDVHKGLHHVEKEREEVPEAAKESASAYALRYLLLPGKVDFELGQKLMIESKTAHHRVSTIVKVEKKRIQVHYDGFPDEFDEWVDRDSSRVLGMAGTTTSTTLTTTTVTETFSTTTTTSRTETSTTETTTTVTTSTTTSETSTTTTTPRRYLSLFCFTLVRGSGLELDLVRLQVAKAVGIFDCDENSIFSDVKTWISQGPTFVQGADGSRSQVLIETLPIHEPLAPPVDLGALDGNLDRAVQKLTPIWQNAAHFVECWRKVLADGKYKFHDWVVKTDPDTVFLPARLRTQLGKTPYVDMTPRNAYLRTCAVTPRKCVFEITLSRTWGDDWSIVVLGEQSDEFKIGGCDSTSDAGSGCRQGGWGNGINTVVNQRDEVVGWGNCCNEGNAVVRFTPKCPQKQTEKNHPGIAGSLEVYTRRAIDLYSKEGTKCLLDVSYKTWGEEYFMQECMDYLGAEAVEADTMVQDKYCNGAPRGCKSVDQVAFHPLSSEDKYFKCYAESFKDLQVTEQHPNLLKLSAADG